MRTAFVFAMLLQGVHAQEHAEDVSLLIQMKTSGKAEISESGKGEERRANIAESILQRMGKSVANVAASAAGVRESTRAVSRLLDVRCDWPRVVAVLHIPRLEVPQHVQGFGMARNV